LRLLVAVQPTRGLDVGACEYIHRQLVAERDRGKGVLLVSLELDEVMDVSDRILVIFEGKLVADVRPREVSFKDIGLYMAGSVKRESA
jgi:simple sugar transport system ATP-binding protein